MKACCHILPGRKSIFGKWSTMVEVQGGEDPGIINLKCTSCIYQCSIRRHYGKIQVQDKRAEEHRAGERVRFWRDILQPTKPDGSENKAFTKQYKYNPAAEDPGKRIDTTAKL